ncbi:MAG: hypothetical protein A2W98_03835 [Bacteroidetes bacterium GWF2_33_38]|nr:MAG: hypothetical protein A2W98_03835 [Bacteroidetes bacterium GWF2_33_38]OFY75714.1 MAG: hypothetical protein A2265_04450 [Bacteroidetes bacterium RIFOXYA12_FULL_33_9]
MNFKNFITALLLCFFISNSFAQPLISKQNSLNWNLSIMNKNNLYWFSSKKTIKRANEWLTEIEKTQKIGVVSSKTELDEIRDALLLNKKVDSINKQKIDNQITKLILSFLKNYQEGNIKFEYDEISVLRDSVYVTQFLNSISKEPISKILARLECRDANYLILKKYLIDSILEEKSYAQKSIFLAMNYRRFFNVYCNSEYILVNIPTTQAEYFNNDTVVLKMRTVVGTKTNKTPTIASYITSVITFPYWNVPRTIAEKEMIPKLKENEEYLTDNNFEIVDSSGNIVDTVLVWKDYETTYFPFHFRQSTGAENAMGVLKFNLQNPFSIYLHSTNSQSAFDRKNRFLSHGCIRLEKPFDLADALLRGNIDIKKLKNGKSNSETNSIKLPQKIQTFIIYSPTFVENNKVVFLKDVYGLVK